MFKTKLGYSTMPAAFNERNIIAKTIIFICKIELISLFFAIPNLPDKETSTWPWISYLKDFFDLESYLVKK